MSSWATPGSFRRPTDRIPMGLPRWCSLKAFCCVDDGINHAHVHLEIVYASEALVFDEDSTLSLKRVISEVSSVFTNYATVETRALTSLLLDFAPVASLDPSPWIVELRFSLAAAFLISCSWVDRHSFFCCYRVYTSLSTLSVLFGVVTIASSQYWISAELGEFVMSCC